MKATWRFLSYLASSLRQGKDLDLIVLVVVAVTVAVLGSVGKASDPLINSVMLALLALLGVSLLNFRYQVERFSSLVGNADSSDAVAKWFFKKDQPFDAVVDRVKKSKSVWLWGAALQAHIPHLVEIIRERLPEGLHIKVLLVEPGSAALEMNAFRGNATTLADMNNELMVNINKLRTLAASAAPGSLEVRVVNYLPPYTLYAYNVEMQSGALSPDGEIEVRVSTFRGSHWDRPSFSLTRKGGGEWYVHFCEEFQKVWGAASPVVASEGTHLPQPRSS